MDTAPDLNALKGMDVYLIDQILKGRYTPGQRILDAGVGGGRNLNWFTHGSFEIHACDVNPACQDMLQERYPTKSINWNTCDLSAMDYPDGFFDHAICNAVLHFANDETQHAQMLNELARITRPGGNLFIRTCSDIGLGSKEGIGHGRFRLGDGSERFLLTESLISEFVQANKLSLIEPLRSVNVENLRVMTTLVLARN